MMLDPSGDGFIGSDVKLSRTGDSSMASDFVGLYAQQLRDAFAPLIPRDRASALIDFPDSPNCGEHAIWLGQKRLLSELGIPIVYECSAQSYDRDAMAARIGAGIILMQGGGNL